MATTPATTTDTALATRSHRAHPGSDAAPRTAIAVKAPAPPKAEKKTPTERWIHPARSCGCRSGLSLDGRVASQLREPHEAHAGAWLSLPAAF